MYNTHRSMYKAPVNFATASKINVYLNLRAYVTQHEARDAHSCTAWGAWRGLTAARVPQAAAFTAFPCVAEIASSSEPLGRAASVLRATPRGFYLARLTGLGGAYDGYIAPCITIEVLVLTPLCIA